MVSVMLSEGIAIATQNPILVGGVLLIGSTFIVSIIQGVLEMGMKIAKLGGLALLVFAGIRYAGII